MICPPFAVNCKRFADNACGRVPKERRHILAFEPRAPNGSDAKLRGQGPRAEADAALGVHACESRDAGRAPP